MGQIIDNAEVIIELGLSDSITEEERAIVATAITRAEGAVKRFLKYDPVQRTRTEYYPQQDFQTVSKTAVWEVQGSQAILRRGAYGDNSELAVQHIPIRSITTLAIDYDGRSGAQSGAFASETEKTEGTDFWPNYDGNDEEGNPICRDGIIRSIGAWPTAPGSVKIVYLAGYTDDEIHGQGGVVDASPIMDVVIAEACRRARRAFTAMKTSAGWTSGPIISERMGDYSVRVDSSIAKTLFGGEWDLMPGSTEKLNSYTNFSMSW